jgi:hypothetical protein
MRKEKGTLQREGDMIHMKERKERYHITCKKGKKGVILYQGKRRKIKEKTDVESDACDNVNLLQFRTRKTK